MINKVDDMLDYEDGTVDGVKYEGRATRPCAAEWCVSGGLRRTIALAYAMIAMGFMLGFGEFVLQWQNVNSFPFIRSVSMKHLKLLSASILMVSALLLNGVSGGNEKHQNQTNTHNFGAIRQSNPTPSPLTVIVQPAPVKIIQTSSAVERENKSTQKWYERPSVTDWGILCVTLLYTLISIGLLNATRKQSRATREALITDKRAFMYADGILSVWESDSTTGFYNWRFRPRWRNAGETPTRDAIMYVQCEIRDQPLPARFDFPVDENAIGKAFVGPKADMFGGAVPRGGPATAVTPEDIWNVQEGRKLIYLWGWMKYYDSFPNTPQHISHFCWFLSVSGNPRTFVPNTPVADLQAGEFIYEQPAATGVEYVFKHALTQEVAYNSLLIERRKQLHEGAGQALESIFSGQLDDHLGQLAHHYSHSDNFSKAVEYLGRAGQQALQRSAHVDAISSLTAAIDLLQKLPDGHHRIQRELPLQLTLGPAFIAINGYAAPEVERAFARARELCKQLGELPELFPALFGLWAVFLLRGELRTAYALAEQVMRLAQGAHDPALLIMAHTALGDTSFSMGKLLPAMEHFELALSLYDPEHHRQLDTFGGDARINPLSYAAITLWALGYPDLALKKHNEALDLARELSHPHDLAFAEGTGGMFRQYRREAHLVQAAGERLIALSAEHGFTFWLTQARIIRGCALAEQGRNEEGDCADAGGLSRASCSPYASTISSLPREGVH